jgi:hypothetical protein
MEPNLHQVRSSSAQTKRVRIVKLSRQVLAACCTNRNRNHSTRRPRVHIRFQPGGLAVIEISSNRFSKRQFGTYVGLAIVTRTSSEYVLVNGIARRSKRLVSVRGLNANHNRLLKKVLKQAATSACAKGPLQRGLRRGACKRAWTRVWRD